MWYNTKYQPSRGYRSRERYLSASILIGIDVPEERQRQVPSNQKIQRTVERTQVRVHGDMYRSSRRSRRLLRHHELSRENADHPGDPGGCWDPSGTFVDGAEDPQVPEVDFPLLLQHQVQTILMMQRQRRFLRASSLIVEDLPEMGQRQDQTEKIQNTVAKTQGQIAETFSDHPEDPEVCRGTTSCSDRPEIQKTVKIPQQTRRGQSPEGQTRPSVVQGPEWSEPKEARQTRRGQRPKGSGGHRRCGVAFLIHRGVNPGGGDAPGSKPQTEPVQLIVFPGWSGPLAVFCVPLTGPVRSGLGRLIV